MEKDWAKSNTNGEGLGQILTNGEGLGQVLILMGKGWAKVNTCSEGLARRRFFAGSGCDWD